MKHTLLLLSALTAAMFFATSCQKENVQTSTESAVALVAEQEQTEVRANVTNGMLSFQSVTEMETVLCQLLQMTPAQRNAWYPSSSFESMQKLYSQALDECSSFSQIEQYYDLRTKYSAHFMFNETDSTDLMPYLKTGKAAYAPLLNINGDVMIGGKVCNYNDLHSYSDTWMANYDKNTKTVDQATNYLKVYDSKRKMWAEATTIGYIASIIFTAQVKSFWGWNHYNESYTVLLVNTGHGVSFFQNSVLPGAEHDVITTPAFPDNYAVGFGKRSKDSKFIHPASGIRFNIYSTDMGSKNWGPLNIAFPQITLP